MDAKRPTRLGGPRRVLGWVRAIARAVRSDGAATHAGATRHRADHEDRDHGTDRRDDDRGNVDLVHRIAAWEDHTGEESADERADDPEHDVSDDAETLVTLDKEPGQVPGDGADDDPRENAHAAYLHPHAGLSPACWGSFAPKSGLGITLALAARRADYDGARPRNNGMKTRVPRPAKAQAPGR